MRCDRRVMTVAAWVLGLAALLAQPAVRAQTEGADYRALVPAQPTSAPPGKIEVIEFFSYGCPHCAEFYPLVSTWAATLPKDVLFRRVPVGFNRPAWINLQRAYFALQASGDLTRLDGKLFQALHEERLPLFEEPALADWVGKNGGDAQKFTAAYTSFGINNLTVEADKMSEDYQITGIPTMAVAGKYIAAGDTFTLLLANTDKLIAKARAEARTAHAKK
ncbi:MAG TPA: thiol:disulfide interchange protein DsbA/DsbL [Steroidobacteraceae bacterium]|nr:thiol:disulfide interchange protein DsbA/DsbL [Steroidobacteraceae bacterium]